MTVRLFGLAIVSLLEIILVGTTARQPESAGDPAASFLFVYDIRPGMRTQFEDGYERHLEWHRNAEDPFAWYGWYVTTGDSIGRFIDGTFGLGFDAFDRRVDPAGDRADAERNVAPFVEPVARRVYRWRADLGSASFLEQGRRDAHLDVTTYLVHPGDEGRFEDAVRSWLADVHADSRVEAWYQLVVGGPMPTYLRVVPRANFAPLQEAAPGPAVGNSVERIRSETWSYQARLSYFPESRSNQRRW